MTFLQGLIQNPVVNDTIASYSEALSNAAATEEISYLEFLLKGGFMIYPLILLLFFTIYVIIERSMAISKLTKQVPNLLTEVKQQLRAGRLDNALMLCSREGNSTAEILKSGVSTVGRPISEI